MLNTYCNENLLELKEVIVKKVKHNEKIIEIEIEMPVAEMNCPCCDTATRTIHDYRVQKIKDISAFGKMIYLILRKHRYRCTNCGKRFYETNTFLPSYHRMTNRLSAYVIDKLRNTHSFTSVAREVNLSVSTVIQIFDLVSYSTPTLPKLLAIDEFKGNSGGEKYQCIITDPENKIVLDILPQRYSHKLISYFKNPKKRNSNH